MNNIHKITLYDKYYPNIKKNNWTEFSIELELYIYWFLYKIDNNYWDYKLELDVEESIKISKKVELIRDWFYERYDINVSRDGYIKMFTFFKNFDNEQFEKDVSIFLLQN